MSRWNDSNTGEGKGKIAGRCRLKNCLTRLVGKGGREDDEYTVGLRRTSRAGKGGAEGVGGRWGVGRGEGSGQLVCCVGGKGRVVSWSGECRIVLLRRRKRREGRDRGVGRGEIEGGVGLASEGAS